MSNSDTIKMNTIYYIISLTWVYVMDVFAYYPIPVGGIRTHNMPKATYAAKGHSVTIIYMINIYTL